MKKIRIVFSREATEAYARLTKNSENSKINRSILKSINKKLELIKMDVHYGKHLPRKVIPREYIQKYEVNNLFKIELPNFWRMLYTLKTEEKEIEVIAFLLNIVNHSNYNKIFKYKKR